MTHFSSPLFIHDDIVEWSEGTGPEIIFKTFERGQINFDFLPVSIYYGNLRLLKADLAKQSADGYQAKLFLPRTAKFASALSPLQNISWEKTAPLTPLGFTDAQATKSSDRRAHPSVALEPIWHF
jgi:hypothetical protein